jgi:hypothetical protein
MEVRRRRPFAIPVDFCINPSKEFHVLRAGETCGSRGDGELVWRSEGAGVDKFDVRVLIVDLEIPVELLGRG